MDKTKTGLADFGFRSQIGNSTSLASGNTESGSHDCLLCDFLPFLPHFRRCLFCSDVRAWAQDCLHCQLMDQDMDQDIDQDIEKLLESWQLSEYVPIFAGKCYKIYFAKYKLETGDANWKYL